jgi:low temperature requirement protein LtrA
MAEVNTEGDENRPLPPGAQRVTTFELLFDLVYVFAFTRVTGYVAHEHSAVGVLQGEILLTLLWVSWSAFAWLGNQARSDTAVVRVGMSCGMAGVFVIALVMPEAWHDAPGGLAGPLVLAAAFVLARAAHLITYVVLARGDEGLLRQIGASAPPVLLGAVLLVTGAVVGGEWQTPLWFLAVVIDWGGIYVVTRRLGAWRIHSAGYIAERHGLVVILAIGESLLALGLGASEQPASLPLVVAGVLGIANAVALWWLYFDVSTLIAEHSLGRTHGRDRVQVTTNAYGYGHLPIVAGIVLAAVGIEGVVVHAESTGDLGLFSAALLCGGTALYLAGLIGFGWVVKRRWSPFRLSALLLLVAAVPLAGTLPPVAAMVGVVAVLAFVAALETWWYADLRHLLRG